MNERNPMASHFTGIDTVILRVREIAAATAWYVAHLGGEAIYEDEDQRLAVIEFSGGSTLTLWQVENDAEVVPSSTYPILATGDARAAHAALRTAGVDVGALKETPGVIYFRLQDPDGNPIEGCEVKD
jgi:catechol 2,3-dioxygenase-like lactoylglutathione lyase family enzyme